MCAFFSTVQKFKLWIFKVHYVPLYFTPRQCASYCWSPVIGQTKATWSNGMLYWIPAFWFNVWGCVGGVECLVDDAKVWTLYCTLWDRGLLVKRTKHRSLSSELKDWSERIRRLNALIKGMIFVFQRYRKSNHNHNDNSVTYLISWFNYFCFQKNNVSLWALFFTWENLLAMVDIGVTSLILYLFNLSFGSKCSLDPLTRFPLGPRTSGSKLYKNRGLFWTEG